MRLSNGKAVKIPIIARDRARYFYAYLYATHTERSGSQLRITSQGA